MPLLLSFERCSSYFLFYFFLLWNCKQKFDGCSYEIKSKIENLSIKKFQMNLKALTLATIAALCFQTYEFQPRNFFNMPRPKQFPSASNPGNFDRPDDQSSSSQNFKPRPKFGSGGSQQPVPKPPKSKDPVLKLTQILRSIDGTGNNQRNQRWGASNEQLQRKIPPVYENGINSLVTDRPPARTISNIVGSIQTPLKLSDKSLFLIIFGQFTDHDLSLTREQGGQNKESFKVPIPKCDPFLDKKCTGNQFFPFTRSKFTRDNPRQQPNEITSFLDAGTVYGSDSQTQAKLRVGRGGLMKTTGKDLLSKDQKGLFIAGDVRVNQNTLLTAIHTLFQKEHNRLCAQFARKYPSLNDQQLYQMGRNYVIGLIQKITYEQFLVELLGRKGYNSIVGAYKGYNPNVNPGVPTEFSAAAFRFGHTLIVDTFPQINENNQVVKNHPLRELFFRPDLINQNTWQWLINGAIKTTAKEKNGQLVDGIRNFLITTPDNRQMKFDLLTLNIVRGRDHGLGTYNDYRRAHGLCQIKDFSEIASHQVARRLQQAYGDVDKLELWVGVVCERSAVGGVLGELGSRVVGQVFKNVRDGDRFWYENAYPKQVVQQIKATSFADVIRRNTNLKINSNPFKSTSNAGSGRSENPSFSGNDFSSRKKSPNPVSSGFGDFKNGFQKNVNGFGGKFGNPRNQHSLHYDV